LQAKAYDVAGNMGGSALITISTNNVFPGYEICDGVDNDGDGKIDEDQLGMVGFCQSSALQVPLNPANNILDESILISQFDKAYYTTDGSPVYSKSYMEAQAPLSPVTANCTQPQFLIYSGLSGLITMYQAVNDPVKAQEYLSQAKHIADLMISGVTVFDPNAPAGWSAANCMGQGATYRSPQNELQGLKGISRLARAMKENGESGWETYYDFVAPRIDYYSSRLSTQWDHNTLFVQCALDLWKMKGDNKYLTYSNTIMNKLNDLNPNKNYFIEDSSSLRMKKSLVPNPDLQDLDTDNANRFAEFIVQLHQDNVDRMPTDLLKTVNTFLFRIWEADYKVELTDAVSQMPAIRYYPGLFKNYSSGKNTCWGAFPPYRSC
jgi:hypothetical protein